MEPKKHISNIYRRGVIKLNNHMLHYPHNHPYFKDEHPIMLDEMFYKDLLHSVDPRDLPHRDYAPLVRFVKYVATERNVLKFYVPSPTPQKYQNFSGLNLWTTFIQFMEWDDTVLDASINPVEASRLILWGANLRIHCPCPAYKFWGMQYIDTQLGIAMIPEPRFPGIRNPHLRGLACKHLRRTIKVLPFHLGDMAKEIKQQRLGAAKPSPAAPIEGI
jgi:hypothetical protein